MCWLSKLAGTEKPKPPIELLRMPAQAVLQELPPNVKMLYGALDYEYYYTKAEHWAAALDWIYFKFDMPKYLADRMDCDDFAFLLKALVSSFFGLNYFGAVFGQTPMGYHAWNLFRVDNGLLQFEPQTGKVFEMDEKGYVPEWLLI